MLLRPTEPRDLAAIREGLAVAARCAELLAKEGEGMGLPEELGRIAGELRSVGPELGAALGAALVDDPPHQRRDGGFVREGYRDELDEARRLGDRALQSSPQQPGYAAHAHHLLGDIATHPDGFDAESGEAHYRKALALAEPRGMRPLVAHCHLGLGRLYRITGERLEAQEHLTTATTMYREIDMRFWLEQAEAELRSVS